MNVIEINSSDDEFGDQYGLDELDSFDDEPGSQGGRSQYFQDANVAAFNAQRKYLFSRRESASCLPEFSS